MEITESLSNDIKIAPEWFHSSVSIEPRQENLKQPLGNLKYQVWDRENAKNILVLIQSFRKRSNRTTCTPYDRNICNND